MRIQKQDRNINKSSAKLFKSRRKLLHFPIYLSFYFSNKNFVSVKRQFLIKFKLILYIRDRI